MKKLSYIVESLQDQLFSSVISNNLIYNTCWEDPRIDRRLLDLDSDSNTVMLTSAGCNALDYLLDDPARIHCVDANPAQNALLELKRSLFYNQNYDLLWDLFGEGQKRGADLVYHNKLRPFLQDSAKDFWDTHIGDFTPSTNQPSFYFSGTSGKVALMVYNRLQRKGLTSQVHQLLNAQTLDEQQYYFDEIEPQLWNLFSKWLIRQHATMSLLGVPSTQQQMIKDKYEHGLLHFIRESLEHVFTEVPISDNYFWRVYMTGSYSKNCCPNYLQEKHFDSLVNRVNRISTYTSTLLDFLRKHPGKYTHFVLLDHQDWMADAKPELLAKEWKYILKNAAPGARILFRSAGATLNFLPDFVFNHVDFQPEQTDKLHSKDRVGTYESTHLGIVK